MTCARKDIHDPETSGFFHCYSRCVRRAFLCGFDRLSQKSFDHRKDWIVNRLSTLVRIFAIRCYAYAPMDDHLHSLLQNLPQVSKAWSDQEVARRWRLLFPRKPKAGMTDEEHNNAEIEQIVSQPNLVALYRRRLSDISWFNRCLNENIARRANAEDECTGRFWEGRFKCQALEGDAAVLSCAAYIDLNRIRAGCAATPEASDYTSIQDRIREFIGKPNPKGPELASFKEGLKYGPSSEEYIKLVDMSGRVLREGKQAMDGSLAPIMERLGIRVEAWPESVKAHRKLFRRVVAPLERLKALAQERGKCWFQGAAGARLLFV